MWVESLAPQLLPGDKEQRLNFRLVSGHQEPRSGLPRTRSRDNSLKWPSSALLSQGSSWMRHWLEWPPSAERTHAALLLLTERPPVTQSPPPQDVLGAEPPCRPFLFKDCAAASYADEEKLPNSPQTPGNTRNTRLRVRPGWQGPFFSQAERGHPCRMAPGAWSITQPGASEAQGAGVCFPARDRPSVFSKPPGPVAKSVSIKTLNISPSHF